MADDPIVAQDGAEELILDEYDGIDEDDAQAGDETMGEAAGLSLPSDTPGAASGLVATTTLPTGMLLPGLPWRCDGDVICESPKTNPSQSGLHAHPFALLS